MLVALGVKHTRRMRRIVICGLPGCAVFFHIIVSNGTIFGENLLNIRTFVLIFCTTFV
jgi:hypothetical protein